MRARLFLIAALSILSSGDTRTSANALIADIALPLETRMVSARVLPGATLASLLRAHHVAVDEVAAVVAKTAAVFDPRRVRVNQPYRLETSSIGSVHGFEYEIDNDRFLRVGRSPDRALVARVLPIPKTVRVEVVNGRIDGDHASLVAALQAAGETVELTRALAGIFDGEIDFTTGVQRGDRFGLTVEKQFREDGRFVGYGSILAAEFTNAGRRVRSVRFAPDGRSAGYYDEHGRSMHRLFLASPLKFQPVITSVFSPARLHPVLREVRPHLGVDYRAPAGAPVVAVADGVVVSAGASGGAGQMVHLRHVNGFETEYLHLSAIVVKPGSRVRQGELVGRVGSTGLATGPHLDYRLKQNGIFVNPIAAQRMMPPADPIPAAQLGAFGLARDRAMAAFSTRAAARVVAY